MSGKGNAAAAKQVKAAQAARAAAAAANTNTASSSSSSSSSTAAPSSSRRGGAPVRSRWAIDLTDSRSAPSTFLTSGVSSSDVVPWGYSSAGVSYDSGSTALLDDKSAARDEAKQSELIHAAAMAVAQAPGKQLFMTMFMLWMSGNSLQIFSIMMLGMALWTPVQEILNVNAKFARFADSNVSMLLPKLTFVALHCAGLAIGLYKCNTMGLLPTSTADWIDPTLRPPVQVAGGGII